MATHDERDRMLQVYFPVPGRMYCTPEMFQEQNIEVSWHVAHLSVESTLPPMTDCKSLVPSTWCLSYGKSNIPCTGVNVHSLIVDNVLLLCLSQVHTAYWHFRAHSFVRSVTVIRYSGTQGSWSGPHQRRGGGGPMSLPAGHHTRGCFLDNKISEDKPPACYLLAVWMTSRWLSKKVNSSPRQYALDKDSKCWSWTC